MTDDSIIVNGVAVTARMLAEARQELARKSPFNAGFYPAFSELTEQEQRSSELDAANYLRALVAIAPAPVVVLCCEFHDRGDEPCAPDDQGGYCCDDCPTLAATATAPALSRAGIEDRMRLISRTLDPAERDRMYAALERELGAAPVPPVHLFGPDAHGQPGYGQFPDSCGWPNEQCIGHAPRGVTAPDPYDSGTAPQGSDCCGGDHCAGHCGGITAPKSSGAEL